MGRIDVRLEVERAAAVLGGSRLAEPDRMPCFSIAGRTSDAIFVFGAEQRKSGSCRGEWKGSEFDVEMSRAKIMSTGGVYLEKGSFPKIENLPLAYHILPTTTTYLFVP